MNPNHASTEAAPSELDFIVADADYYEAKAHRCLRLARVTQDDRVALTLRSLALAYEEKARTLKE